ncbi:MAG: S8 family serine peptidase [bacterium]|nr:S8 family serine peptidase [bacterium]
MNYFVFSACVAIFIHVIAPRAHAQAVPDTFYYGTSTPVILRVDSSRVCISFLESTSIYERTAILDNFPGIGAPINTPDTMDGYRVYAVISANGYLQLLNALNAIEQVDIAAPFYRFPDSVAAPIGKRLCVRFNDDITPDSAENIAQSLNVILIGEIPGMHNVYTAYNASVNGSYTVNIANTLHLHPSTVYAHPSIGGRFERTAYRTFDFYATYQPHLKRVIGELNVRSVWDFGGLTRSMTVAVIDDGVASHEDLPVGKIDRGIDFYGGVNFGDIDMDPSPGVSEAHGQGCAGIIAALHTTDSASGQLESSGMISIGPRTRILPIKIFSDDGDAFETGAEAALAIVWAYQNGADVLSNSWSADTPWMDDPTLSDAIHRAVAFGRNGRGCPVFFSSGNGYFSNCQYPSNLPFVFAVGASHHTSDRYWDYSSYGPELDALAPSGNWTNESVWSLDQMGSNGYNPSLMSDCLPQSNNQNYDCHFGGTSAACPIAAGIAALLLAKDSTLSAEAIYYIIRESADTALAWGAIAPPNDRYGYGVVNAFNAILSISHGDLTNDNSIDLSDLSLLIAYMVRTPRPTIFPSIMLADMNCSGTIDISDLNWMIYFVTSAPGTVPGPVSPCFRF